jgi:hypothetical protein
MMVGTGSRNYPTSFAERRLAGTVTESCQREGWLQGRMPGFGSLGL